MLGVCGPAKACLMDLGSGSGDGLHCCLLGPQTDFLSGTGVLGILSIRYFVQEGFQNMSFGMRKKEINWSATCGNLRDPTDYETISKTPIFCKKHSKS